MKPRETTLLRLDDITVGDRLRTVSEEDVDRLARSMSEIGLRTPISARLVWNVVIDGKEWENALFLVTGATRLAAAKKLGWEKIECFVGEDIDEIDAQLWEIDENLCRIDLGPTDRARQTALRKTLYEERHPETRHGGDHKSIKRQSLPLDQAAFVADTATMTGKSERIVRLDAERGRKVIDEVKDLIRGTRLDTGTYLDKLKSMPPSEQVVAAKRDLITERRRAREDKAKPVALVKEPLNDFEAREKQVSRLMDAWNAACAEAREDFLGRVDKPLMDRAAGGWR